MISLLAVILLAGAPASAQDGPDAYTATPEQFPGQLSRLRLEMLYPKLVAETTHPADADPSRRLEYFLRDSKPVLKNLRGLTDYLREGLRDPQAIDGSRKRWTEAWSLLDVELSALWPLVAEGESLGGAAPAPAPVSGPEFASPEGARLRRALVAAAYARGLRDRLAKRKTSER